MLIEHAPKMKITKKPRTNAINMNGSGETAFEIKAAAIKINNDATIEIVFPFFSFFWKIFTTTATINGKSIPINITSGASLGLKP